MISAKAAVYHFNSQTESWTPVDAGLSKVEIFNNPTNNSYRVVGVSYKNQAIVINSQIFKQTGYSQVNLTIFVLKNELINYYYYYFVLFMNKSHRPRFINGLIHKRCMV